MASRKMRTRTSPKQLAPSMKEATQATFAIKRYLKTTETDYLRVASLLVQVRDRRLYAFMHFKNLGDYAANMLRLDGDAVKRYLKIHDWVKARYPRWLRLDRKRFVPNLNGLADLMYIESGLAKRTLWPTLRVWFKKLKAKALKGRLKSEVLDGFRDQKSPEREETRDIMEELKEIRQTAIDSPKEITPKVLPPLNALVALMENSSRLWLTGLDCLDEAKKSRSKARPKVRKQKR
jgi:hypothetical protein